MIPLLNRSDSSVFGPPLLSGLQTFVQKEQLKQLEKMVPLGLFSSLFTGSFLVYVLYGQVASEALLYWLASVFLVASIRHPLLFTTLKNRIPGLPLTMTEYIFIGHLASGIVWGASAFVIFPESSITHQAFHILILGGLVAGALGLYSIKMVVFYSFSIPVLGPMVIHQFMLGEIQRVMGVLLLYFFMLTSLTAKRVNANMQHSLELQYANTELISQLTQEKKETVEANKQLEHEIIERKVVEQEISAYKNNLEKLVSERTADLEKEVAGRLKYQEEVAFQAFHDPLTGLPNRNKLKERLIRAIQRNQRNGKKVALFFLDIDDFKVINDTLGHDIGDLLLQQTANRLAKFCRTGDTLARLGGDEFMFIFEGIDETLNDVQCICKRLQDGLRQPFRVEDYELKVCTSIGITIYPDDGQDIEILIRNSDMAMYSAKAQGKNSYAFFTASMHADMLHRVELEHDLLEAVNRQEFTLFYQPKVNIVSGRVTGAEALIRWQKADGTMVFPDEFIPLAESTGLIIPIGEWVLETACQQAKEWNENGFVNFNIAVNISANQFQNSNLPEIVDAVLRKTNLAPGNLTLEITENIVMADIEAAISVMGILAAKRVSIAIDDFGTGYSSLSYLKRFPVSILKVDRSFVKDLPDDMDDITIVKSIISLAHNLGMTVVAEGAETKEQINFLLDCQCEEVQGYYYSKPIPAQDFYAFLLESETALNNRQEAELSSCIF